MINELAKSNAERAASSSHRRSIETADLIFHVKAFAVVVSPNREKLSDIHHDASAAGNAGKIKS